MRDNRRVSSTSLHDDGALTPDGAAPDDVAPDAAEGAAGDAGPAPDRGSRAARRVEPDAVCAAAVDLARAAAEELADAGTVGDHLGLLAEGERLVVHSFACLSRGYRGWRWAVSVARAPRSRQATVCEVVLLPGTDALLPPAWVPWSQRLAPGDVGVGDELPYREDDPYLEPGYAAARDEDDEEQDRVALWELGLGRTRVLAREGRDAAAERWYRGSHGPTADIALHAAASCSSCAYLVHLSGALRQVFGVCANEWSPSDGRVVSLDHGCGAHSETDAAVPEPEPLPEPILDETGVEPVVLPARDQAEDAATVVEPEADVAVAEVVAEVSEPGALEVTEVTGTVAPDEDEVEDEPDPEAPAHDVPDPEAPAHVEPDYETPAHEAKIDDPVAADALPEEPDPQP
jgi:hypothetical protein